MTWSFAFSNAFVSSSDFWGATSGFFGSSGRGVSSGVFSLGATDGFFSGGVGRLGISIFLFSCSFLPINGAGVCWGTELTVFGVASAGRGIGVVAGSDPSLSLGIWERILLLVSCAVSKKENQKNKKTTAKFA